MDIPQPNQTDQIKKLSTASELLQSSWEIYKNRIKVLLAISIIGTGLALAITPFSLPEQTQKPFEGFEWTLDTIIFLAVFVILYAFFSIWVQAATITAVQDESTGFKSAFASSVSKVPGLFWTQFLIGLSVLIGFVLLVIPAFIFGIWFSLAPLVFMFEGKKGLQALWASKAYVSGNFWAVTGRWVVLGLIFLAFMIPRSFMGPEIKVYAETYGLIVSFFLGPYVSVYAIQLYRSLRDLKAHINPSI